MIQRSVVDSRARLQSRQFLAHAGDARADQGLVADEPEGNQGRREDREPRPLCRVSEGGSCLPEKFVRGYPGADRRPAAAAYGIDGVESLSVMARGSVPALRMVSV